MLFQKSLVGVIVCKDCQLGNDDTITEDEPHPLKLLQVWIRHISINLVLSHPILELLEKVVVLFNEFAYVVSLVCLLFNQSESNTSSNFSLSFKFPVLRTSFLAIDRIIDILSHSIRSIYCVTIMITHTVAEVLYCRRNIAQPHNLIFQNSIGSALYKERIPLVFPGAS